MSFIYLITKGFEDSFTCGCDTTDSVRYLLRANKIDLSLKTTPQKKVFFAGPICFQQPCSQVSSLQGVLYPNKISGVGTDFGLLVHVLPGPNKRRVEKRGIVLS
jgi:hypothetical protein